MGNTNHNQVTNFVTTTKTGTDKVVDWQLDATSTVSLQADGTILAGTDYIVASGDYDKIRQLTQTEYNALTGDEPYATTLYVIVGA